MLLAGLPENLATFDIKFGAGGSTTISSDFDTNTIPTTSHLETEAETNKVVELVNNVVDSELETSSTSSSTADSEADGDYVYEYVYYYYDEDGVNGTVVDAQVASSSSVKVLGQNVTGVDIHTNTGNPPLTASQHTPSSPGDTPTIYAAAAENGDVEKVDGDEESKGMSIFGIPIPSIPISLSFGLVPALSQVFANGGLIPLGRKGEASQEKHAIGAVPPEEYDQTRGPDTQIPVWVDRLKDIDFKKVASLFPEASSSLEEILHSKSQSQESLPSEYSYAEPNNPLIPLSGEQEDPRSSGYFPHSAGGYFPTSGENLPILKFDHPIHPQLPPSSPIIPPTSPRKRHTSKIPQRNTESFEPLFIPAGRDGNIKKETVSLRPEVDYQFTGNTLIETVTKRKPAFPGIEATMRNDYLNPVTPRTAPSLDFDETAPAANANYEYEYHYEEQETPYAANIPEYLDDYGYLKDDAFSVRSTAKPATEKPRTTTEIRDNTLGQETTEFNEVVTEADTFKATTSFYDPRKGSKSKKEKEFVESLIKQNNAEKVEIYEVTTRTPIKLESTEESIGIDVAHKGTPKEDNLGEEAVFTTEKPPEYEYEYEYEYVYEDELGYPYEDDDVAKTTTEPTSQESLQSILSFLNKESTTHREKSHEESLREKALGNLPPLTLTHLRQQNQPTPLPPIRSSTFLYDQQGNYPEVQRSTVTVEIEDRFGRSRSSLSPEQGPTARSAASPASAYPFHPDRMDPASSPHAQGEGGDNSVNWYYSSYNNENTDPYIGPKGRSASWALNGGLLLPLTMVLASLLV